MDKPTVNAICIINRQTATPRTKLCGKNCDVLRRVNKENFRETRRSKPAPHTQIIAGQAKFSSWKGREATAVIRPIRDVEWAAIGEQHKIREIELPMEGTGEMN
jgi:hypothetical protein